PAKRHMKSVEVPTGEKSMFGLGKEIMKTEKKPTKNVVISERDYKNLVTAARDNDRLKQHVRNLMSTDMAREYKKLSKEHEIGRASCREREKREGGERGCKKKEEGR